MLFVISATFNPLTIKVIATQEANIFQKLNVSNMVKLARKMDAYYENDAIDFA